MACSVRTCGIQCADALLAATPILCLTHAAVTEDELKAMFAEHGTVNSCVIMHDDDGKSKVGGGRVGFVRAGVCVLGAGICMANEAVRLLQPASALMIHTVVPTPGSSCCHMQGFGFVNFEAPEQAAAAVSALNGKDVRTGMAGLADDSHRV